MDMLLRSLAGILLAILFALGTLGFLSQGPVATILIGFAWTIRMRGRPDRTDITSLNTEPIPETEEPEEGPVTLREGTYVLGLVVASIAVLLDWICLIEFFTKDRSRSAETLEAMTYAVPVVAGIAFVIALTGRGAGWVFTVLTSCLIAFGSFGLIVLEGCQHMSW